MQDREQYKDQLRRFAEQERARREHLTGREKARCTMRVRSAEGLLRDAQAEDGEEPDDAETVNDG